jgi:hypothetical protein
MQSLELISQQDLRAQASVCTIECVSANRQEINFFSQAQVHYLNECVIRGMLESVSQ